MSVRTKVRVVLDIKTNSAWGDDTTIAQVKKQSLDDAMLILTKAIKTNDSIHLSAQAECINVIVSETN